MEIRNIILGSMLLFKNGGVCHFYGTIEKSKAPVTQKNRFIKISRFFLSINKEIFRGLYLEKAAEMFLDGNHSVNDVAWNVGFRNVRYFKKCFIKRFKMTPQEFIDTYKKV